MNAYYSAIVFIAIATMVTSIIHLRENETISRRVKQELKTIAIFIILGTLCEFLGTCLDGAREINHVSHGLVKAIEFSISPIIPVYYIKIVGPRELNPIIKIVVKTIIIINAICEIVSIFIPFIFSINEENIYEHGKFYIIYNLTYLGGIAIFLYELQKYLKKYQNRNKITLISLITFLIAGFSIRFLNSDIHTDWIVVAITYLLFIMYYSDLKLKVDALTDLLNRKSYENRLKKLDYPSAIILIDANDFKLVNDNYGHQCGDNVLRVIAKAILKVYGECGHCYRIGGDEFCIILKQGVVEEYSNAHPNTNFSNFLDDLGKKLDSEIEKQCEEYPMLVNGVSKGYAIYSGLYDLNAQESANNPYGLTSVKETVKLADERMYEDKERNKKK